MVQFLLPTQPSWVSRLAFHQVGIRLRAVHRELPPSTHHHHHHQTVVLISPYPHHEGNKLGSMSGTRAISTTSRRELSSSFFPARQSAEGNLRHSDRNINLFLPGRAKDLSTPLSSSSSSSTPVGKLAESVFQRTASGLNPLRGRGIGKRKGCSLGSKRLT